MYVHRKGATPAGKGELGVIPGNMVEIHVLSSAAEARRPVSIPPPMVRVARCREQQPKEFNWKQWRDYLSKRNVHLLPRWPR